jgi:UV DNA damage repair endonuclease
MNMTQKRIGFCCKWIDTVDQLDGFKPKDDALRFNNKTTTVAWMNRQTKAVAEQRLWDIMEHNTNATLNLVKRVGLLEPELRMVRLSSDIFPLYTESTYSYYYNLPDVRETIAARCAAIGEAARSLDVRVSFHPGQFCVLASDNENTVGNSIREFEYHTDLARWMGYGTGFHDHGFKINVHISGRKGPEGIRAVFNRLSPEARNLITIENEEYTYGLDACLTLGNILPIVFDTHHHWIHSGEYLSPTDDRIKMVKDSWRGVRPTLHYSVSRESMGISDVGKPDLSTLIESGHKKGTLRAHSDFMWNSAVNEYIAEFWDDFDIQVESKAKNLASTKLYEELTKENK